MFRPLGIVIWALAITLLTFQLAMAPVLAQDTKLKKEELDQLLAPIALYPDDLLTNVLMASTYPLDVVQAARWRKEPTNSKLKGDALVKALEAKDWDPSIKALVQSTAINMRASSSVARARRMVSIGPRLLVVFQKNLGPDTADLVAQMTTFNPDSSWSEVKSQ
jgi:hypothetical protein